MIEGAHDLIIGIIWIPNPIKIRIVCKMNEYVFDISNYFITERGQQPL
jgi:hypothetical protein